jgi:hypothetical protein
LWQAASAGQLGMAEERATQAGRLIAEAGAATQVQRFVKEWLGIDGLENVGKDASFSNYEALRPQMTAESNDFIFEVFRNDVPTVSTLLGADFTVAQVELAQMYGVTGGSERVSLAATERRGILLQSAFLSAHANVGDSGPIKRGATLLGTVLCLPVPDPAEVGVLLTVPEPDPSQTTRQRFAAHSVDTFCSGCHSQIDPLGFAFEAYDAMGTSRDTDNGQPVDTSGAIPESIDVGGPVSGSRELVERLSQSKDVERCFARQMFRFASAQSAGSPETRFIDGVWASVEPELQGSIPRLLQAFAASDALVFRRTP